MSTAIRSTKDYHIFKKHESNREISQPALARLKRSILAKNMLHLRPILVDAKMKIIDGQHRLEVAQELGIPIFYTLNPDATVDDMVFLNTQQSWDLQDYLAYFCSLEKKDYVQFKAFMDRHNLTLRMTMKLVSDSSGRFYDTFKLGTYQFPSEERIQESLVTLRKIQEITDFILTKTVGHTDCVKRLAYVQSLILLFNIESVEFDTLKRKLALALDLFHPCTKVGSYLAMWRDIYNWKNKLDPIRVDQLPSSAY